MDRAVSRRVFLAGVAGAVAASRFAHAQEAPTIAKRVRETLQGDRIDAAERSPVRARRTVGARSARPADEQGVSREARRRHGDSRNSDRGAARERHHLRQRGAVDRVDEGQERAGPAKDHESRSEHRQNTEAVEHARRGTLRPHEPRTRRHAVRCARPEMGRRQILDGGTGGEQGVPDGARDRRDRAQHSRSRQHAAHTRHRARQRRPVGHQLGRPLDLQDRREGRRSDWRRSRSARTIPVPHGLDMDRNGVLWYCDAGTGWICKLV